MRRALWYLAAPLVVVLCAGAVAVALANRERNDVAAKRQASAHREANGLREQFDTTISRLETTSGLFAGSHHVSEREFVLFSKPLLRGANIDSVAYIDRVPGSQRAAFERRTGLPIVDGGGPHPPRTAKAVEYFPYSLFSDTTPTPPRTSTPNAAAEPTRRAALMRARDTGTAQTTAPIRTFTDDLPALLAFSPVYRQPLPPRSVAERRRTLRGYAVGVLPLRQLLPASQRGSVTLTDHGRRIAGARSLEDATTVPVLLAGRRFGMRVDTRDEATYAAAIAVALGGLGLAAMIGVVLFVLLRRDDYAQRMVRERLEEQRRAEAALAESERHYRLLSETATDWIALVDTEARFTYSSPSIVALLGRAPDEVLGKTLADVLHPEDVERAVKNVEALVAGAGSPWIRTRAQHSDGHWVPIDTAITILRDPRSDEVEEIRTASRDATEQVRLETELHRLAVEDVLTGLPNRRQLTQRVEDELAASRRYGGGALALFDLDGFKQINDTGGHAVGDHVLARVAEVARGRMRESDLVARLGGDEFAVVLPRVNDTEACTAIGGLLSDLREDPQLLRMHGSPVTASAGIALMRGTTGRDPDTLMMRADQALYASKRAGRDRTTLWESGLASLGAVAT